MHGGEGTSFGGCLRRVWLPVAARPDHKVIGPPLLSLVLQPVVGGAAWREVGFAGVQVAGSQSLELGWSWSVCSVCVGMAWRVRSRNGAGNPDWRLAKAIFLTETSERERTPRSGCRQAGSPPNGLPPLGTPPCGVPDCG
jgi:hypothetical protein